MQERTEAMGHCHALARPGRGDHADWPAWACTGMVLGACCLANASLARAQAVHRYDQQGQGHLQDKDSAESTLMVNTKMVHLDMVLDEVEIVGQVWFKNIPNQGCKVASRVPEKQCCGVRIFNLTTAAHAHRTCQTRLPMSSLAWRSHHQCVCQTGQQVFLLVASAHMAPSSRFSLAPRCSFLLTAALLVLLLSHGAHGHGAGLSSSFYDGSCPGTRDIVRRVIQDARVADARIPASLIRLHFHDCFVNGCDGSLLLDDDPQAAIMTEKNVPANDNSARGFGVVDNIKRALEHACPGVVSCADILALAAEISVELAGGPSWTVPLGRRDGTTTNIESAKNLPSPFDPLETLQEKFRNLGLDDTDLVALQGAHTFGRAQCQFTQRNCTAGQSEGALVNLDGVTPDVFDNKYYGNLLRGHAQLPSDQVMLSDPIAAGTTAPIVRRFSGNQKDFFRNFAASMVKMGNISPLTGRDGDIRKNCRRVNKEPY
ncbi:hypothetical protein QYE76_021604 [Lolium multiflorum]|uniref:Plant heme peroxidase family profile domain-containing protein n=1 Tax=Lolium multiflorum TaxID=4521 RepID=A0AAD8R810_LOLMU|nr:hypothetical protein QYE76_021604 [Lolium multiflorum]